MADCIPTGDEAAVINRKRQASGFEIRTGGGGSSDDVEAKCAAPRVKPAG